MEHGPTGIQIIKDARQAVHAVHDDGVAFTNECDLPFQFWAVGVLAGRLVGKDAIHWSLFKLALGVLLQRADSHLADALPLHWMPQVNLSS